MSRRAALLACALLAGCATVAVSPVDGIQVVRGDSPAAVGLVDVAKHIPDVDLDIRYAGDRNFTGHPVPGYEAPRCYLQAAAADALAAVAADLRGEGMRLRIFDCYRPMRSVEAFMRWVDDAGDTSTRAEYYPALPKSALKGGYIAPRSGHSRAATVDLTLLDCTDGTRTAGACAPLDMGTPFDFFDPLANTDSPSASPAQRANRERLRGAMERHGFANYPMEWWHFTLQPEPAPDVYYDVPVR